MKSRIDSPLGRLTRRSATVTIWAPDSSWACFMISVDEYLPVPTMSRDENSLPPITRLVSYICGSSFSTAAHRADYLDTIAFSELHGRVFALGRDLAIDCHREVLPRHAEEGEQPLDRRPGLQIHRLSVHRHCHEQKRPLPREGAADVPPTCSLRWDYPDQVRGVPGRTRFSGILPPRRTSEVYSGSRAPSTRPGP